MRRSTSLRDDFHEAADAWQTLWRAATLPLARPVLDGLLWLCRRLRKNDAA